MASGVSGEGTFEQVVLTGGDLGSGSRLFLLDGAQQVAHARSSSRGHGDGDCGSGVFGEFELGACGESAGGVVEALCEPAQGVGECLPGAQCRKVAVHASCRFEDRSDAVARWDVNGYAGVVREGRDEDGDKFLVRRLAALLGFPVFAFSTLDADAERNGVVLRRSVRLLDGARLVAGSGDQRVERGDPVDDEVVCVAEVFLEGAELDLLCPRRCFITFGTFAQGAGKVGVGLGVAFILRCLFDRLLEFAAGLVEMPGSLTRSGDRGGDTSECLPGCGETKSFGGDDDGVLGGGGGVLGAVAFCRCCCRCAVAFCHDRLDADESGAGGDEVRVWWRGAGFGARGGEPGVERLANEPQVGLTGRERLDERVELGYACLSVPFACARADVLGGFLGPGAAQWAQAPAPVGGDP
ncbi:hypothetical protein GALL_301230 [mine drainage metagenome]|uniref:Uncharacterized protein n=1 Tax=mine drainage metagenome TaxID=410659 RepID=A0A1J5R7E9_9ZZZZ